MTKNTKDPDSISNSCGGTIAMIISVSHLISYQTIIFRRTRLILKYIPRDVISTLLSEPQRKSINPKLLNSIVNERSQTKMLWHYVMGMWYLQMFQKISSMDRILKVRYFIGKGRPSNHLHEVSILMYILFAWIMHMNESFTSSIVPRMNKTCRNLIPSPSFFDVSLPPVFDG